MKKNEISKNELFAHMPVHKALAAMAVPTIISQMINLIYNMVDGFFIGRTGNSYMMAATSLVLTLTMLHVALSNLFGVGGGSLVARLMGIGKEEKARRVSAFSMYGAAAAALGFALVVGVFMNPILRFFGASDATLGYARAYTLIVIVIGSLPALLSLVTAHLLRNAGFSGKASFGLSLGGVLNVVLDPLFMFVLLPRGYEVHGAAIATLLSNVVSCLYLLRAYRRAGADAPLSLRLADAQKMDRENVNAVLAVGVPSAVLTGLFDLANICVNILAASYNDMVLAGMGIVTKLERLPNAVNMGICQGMLPIVAFNYAGGNRERMKAVIRTARAAGLAVSAACIALFELFAGPAVRLFMSTSAGDAATALETIGYAVLFLRIRCLASPVQFLNYHTSFCMQAVGDGRATLLHAVVRELVFYIPMMFLLNALFGQTGLAAALPVGEGCGAAFALALLAHVLRKQEKQNAARAKTV